MLTREAIIKEESVFGDLHPNAALPNMVEITEGELAQSHFFTYGPVGVGYKQITPDRLPHTIEPFLSTAGQPCMFCIRYWVMHDHTGYAVHADYWGKKLRWFKWAICEHEMKHVSRDGNCLNSYKCSKCGYAHQIDSSD